jgi:hypothetical protein
VETPGQAVPIPPSPSVGTATFAGQVVGCSAKLMPVDETIGGLVGMLDVLCVECPNCNRNGRYQVARLVAELGPDYRLTDWMQKLAINCPQKNQKGVTHTCGLICRA